MYTLGAKAAGLEPYEPGQGHYRIRLDANESFMTPTPADRERLGQIAAETAFNRYPDPAARELCEAYAAAYGLDPATVTAGNGSDELIGVITAAFLQKGERMLTVAPDFSMYRFYAALNETPCTVWQKGEDMQIDVDALLRTAEEQQARLIVFSNPCNPTSLGLPREEVRRLIRGTSALVVLDEAYMDFWDQSLLDEVTDYDNLIILRTCSKALGMAALRVGFAIANETLTRVLRAAKSPYNVGAITQALATDLLRRPQAMAIARELLLLSREQLMTGLRKLQEENLLQVYESCTNFALVRVACARALYEELMERSILVRCLGEDLLRITAGTELENREVLAQLTCLLKKTVGCG